MGDEVFAVGYEDEDVPQSEITQEDIERLHALVDSMPVEVVIDALDILIHTQTVAVADAFIAAGLRQLLGL